MKITVIGAGAIGSAVAYDLIARPGITHVQVCDASPRALGELESRVKTSRLHSFQVNARDPHVLEPILKGSTCVVSCVTPDLNPMLSELCLALGIHFCDLGGNEEIMQHQLGLHHEARKKAVWIVPNCGLAPGLVNILCMAGFEQFEQVDAAHLRVGAVPLDPSAPFNFNVSFSAEKLIEDYTDPVALIQDGQIRHVEPMTGLERIRFPKPFGEMEAFYTSGGLSTLPEDLQGRVRTLDYKTIRFPGHAEQMRFLFALGFAEKRNLDVRTHLTYRDVLIRRMRQRLGGEHQDAVLLRVLLTGTREGKQQTLVYEMVDRYNEQEHLTAIKRCTGFPAAVVASMIAQQQIPGSGGAAPPERIIPKELFFQLLEERNLRITKRWIDGVADVSRLVDAA